MIGKVENIDVQYWAIIKEAGKSGRILCEKNRGCKK